MCSVEYAQALVILAFWGDREGGGVDTDRNGVGGGRVDDRRKGGGWRKVGLAIRIAFELGLHLRKDGGRGDEWGARERLVSLFWVFRMGLSADFLFLLGRTRRGHGFVSFISRSS